LRALAITSLQRSQALPDLPTVAESGLPGFEATQWYGVMAPAGTPDNVVARLNSELVRVVRTPQMKELLIKDASIPSAARPVNWLLPERRNSKMGTSGGLREGR
jgi:tripartite-type tricarboxylate transporter receptor subunit TctC